jgi:hypothetical protein
MKKGFLIAILALATVSATFAGNGSKKKAKQKARAKIECCDQSKCTPSTICVPTDCKPSPSCCSKG